MEISPCLNITQSIIQITTRRYPSFFKKKKRFPAVLVVLVILSDCFVSYLVFIAFRKKQLRINGKFHVFVTPNIIVMRLWCFEKITFLLTLLVPCQQDCTLTWCSSLLASVTQRATQDFLSQAEYLIMPKRSMSRGLRQ